MVETIIVSLSYLVAFAIFASVTVYFHRLANAEKALLLEVLCVEKAPVWRTQRHVTKAPEEPGWKELDLSEFDGVPEGFSGGDWTS